MQNQSGLFTDFYSLSMMQGYYLTKRNHTVLFDMFIRKSNKNIGYMVFTGLQTLIKKITSLKFSDKDLEYLRSVNLFQDDFLCYLKNFRFTGNIYAMKEGSICFPQEPIIKIEAPITEAQLIEGLVLNTINFQTLIATKSARICYAAKGKPVVELGLRRAQGPNGAKYASRSAFIGGVTKTSNTEACMHYNIPFVGTMAHSWVMSYEDEYQAFQDFANIYPNHTTFLLDTHNTIASGLPHAIKMGKILKEKHMPFSVRLDSGDIEYLSKYVRRALDNEELHDTKIIVTNSLDEGIITQLLASNSPIDIIGIGTNLVTGGLISSLSGVYKLAEIHNKDTKKNRPIIKTSNNIEKSSLPSSKQVLRFYREDKYIADLIVVQGEKFENQEPVIYHHPFLEHKHSVIYPPYKTKAMLQQVITNGIISTPLFTIQEIQNYAQQEISKLDTTYQRLINPHDYHVSISPKLKTIRDKILFQT